MKKIALLPAIFISTCGIAQVSKPLIGVEKLTSELLAKHEHRKTLSITKNQGAIVTVGNDVACNYQSQPIQNAIDAGETNIRVVAGSYNESLNLGTSSISIEGGYENCVKAANNDLSGGGTTTIDGAGSSLSAIIIPSSNAVNEILLRRMTIRNGGDASNFSGGGISINNSVSNILLEELNITNNRATFGGGVDILGGNANVDMINVSIANNTANTGGGISCDTDGSITFSDNRETGVGIFSNSAISGDGGGVWLSGGCEMNMYSGQNPNALLDFRGILLNDATGNGGGVHVQNGSTFNAIGFAFFAGDNTSPVSILANTANQNDDDSGNGGGVYVKDVGSIANLYNVNMSNNTAYNGGAVSVENGATVVTESVNQLFDFVFSCWSPGKCNQYSGNEATNDGGVFYASQEEDLGTKIEVFSSQIFENEASGTGAVSFITGAETELFIEGSVIYKNAANFILYNFTDTKTTYQYSTIADNSSSGSSLIRNFRGSLTLRSSIVHNLDAEPVYTTDTPVAESFDCLITHENNSFPNNIATQVNDPQFVDRGNDDYHINSFLSPAVDFCSGAAYPPQRSNDIDYEPRGWDDYIAGNEFGPFDIGADETYQNDVIFEDDLED